MHTWKRAALSERAPKSPNLLHFIRNTPRTTYTVSRSAEPGVGNAENLHKQNKHMAEIIPARIHNVLSANYPRGRCACVLIKIISLFLQSGAHYRAIESWRASFFPLQFRGDESFGAHILNCISAPQNAITAQRYGFIV
jgi:hypothetical protein